MQAGVLFTPPAPGAAVATPSAVFMGRGARDNGKEHIEDGNPGGKGSPAHGSRVTGDALGAPFKGTGGPALDISIKPMTIVSLVLAEAK